MTIPPPRPKMDPMTPAATPPSKRMIVSGGITVHCAQCTVHSSSRAFELLDAADDLAVVGVHAVDLHERLLRVLRVADLDVRVTEVVEEADVLLLVDLRHLESFAIPLDSELRHPFFEEAEAEHRRAFDGALRVFRRELELTDRLVRQP